MGEPRERFFLHGYEWTFEVEFACAETEPDAGVVVEWRARRLGSSTPPSRFAGLATAGRVWVSRVKARESRNHVVTLTAGAV